MSKIIKPGDPKGEPKDIKLLSGDTARVKPNPAGGIKISFQKVTIPEDQSYTQDTAKFLKDAVIIKRVDTSTAAVPHGANIKSFLNTVVVPMENSYFKDMQKYVEKIEELDLFKYGLLGSGFVLPGFVINGMALLDMKKPRKWISNEGEKFLDNMNTFLHVHTTSMRATGEPFNFSAMPKYPGWGAPVERALSDIAFWHLTDKVKADDRSIPDSLATGWYVVHSLAGTSSSRITTVGGLR